MRIIDIVAKEIETNQRYNEMFLKFVPDDKSLRDDLKQEIYLILCTMDQDKLKSIWDKNELRYYVSCLLMRNVLSKTSRFHYKYRKYKLTELNVGDGLSNYNDVEFENDILDKIDFVNKIDWINEQLSKILSKNPKRILEITIFNDYYRNKITFDELQKKYNISGGSCQTYVKRIVKILQRESRKLYI